MTKKLNLPLHQNSHTVALTFCCFAAKSMLQTLIKVL